MADDLQDVEVKVKRWWANIAVWFNGVVPSLAVAADQLKDAFPQLQPYLPTKPFGWAMTVLVVGNVILHVFVKNRGS